MEKKYFLIINDEQQGPFTFDELKERKLIGETPIWYEGLPDWTKVSEIEELKPFIEIKPPVFKQEEKVVPPPFENKKSEKTAAQNKITFETKSTSDKSRVVFFSLLGVVFLLALVWFFMKSNAGSASQKTELNLEPQYPSDNPYNSQSESQYIEEQSENQPSSQELNQKTEKELQQELYEREQANPKKYLDVDATYRVNLAANTIIEGTIYNKASIAAYKNIKIKVEFFSDTDYKLGDDVFVVLENVFANGSISFKQKITGWYENMDHFTCKIVSAENF